MKTLNTILNTVDGKVTEETIDKIRRSFVILDKYYKSSEGKYLEYQYREEENEIEIIMAMSSSYDKQKDFIYLIRLCDCFIIRQTEKTKKYEDGDVVEMSFLFKC
ncbi:MAG: hypothetical protein HUJ53_09305 [Holdemanella sp.]|nr:hypothetical protein [Holdemanella sp.]